MSHDSTVLERDKLYTKEVIPFLYPCIGKAALMLLRKTIIKMDLFII